MVLIMDRQGLIDSIRQTLLATRKKIYNTQHTKFYRENEEFRDMVDNLKEYIKVGARTIGQDPFDDGDIKARKLDDLTDNQLLAYNAKLSEWEKLAGRKGFEDVMEKRLKGIADYLYDENDYSIVKNKNVGFSIVHKDKVYKMSYTDISEFWKKFGELYRKSRLKDLKDYENEGVSYIFELYYDEGIEDVDELTKIIGAKYDEENAENIEMLRNAQDDLDKLMPTPRRH